MKKEQKRAKEKELIEAVLADFEQRKERRKKLELQWRLNMDFYAGRQNGTLSRFDTIVDSGMQFHWQRAESFNHIGPIIESRLAAITSDKVDVSPVPLTDNDIDVQTAHVCKKILDSAFGKVGFDRVQECATMWSETCGTAFYKVF